MPAPTRLYAPNAPRRRGHALTIDAGWREVAEKALEFVKRFA